MTNLGTGAKRGSWFIWRKATLPREEEEAELPEPPPSPAPPLDALLADIRTSGKRKAAPFPSLDAREVRAVMGERLDFSLRRTRLELGLYNALFYSHYVYWKAPDSTAFVLACLYPDEFKRCHIFPGEIFY